ncbi:MAG: hypothetical protein GC155_00925 [Alphaproteobacteria bacterium]|nr:hypothetical protein [Alphaproteobacteria bacterium]
MNRRKGANNGLAAKAVLATGVSAAIAMLSGCADLMTRSAVAPAWFQSKAVEVKGEGYPDLHKIPVTRKPSADKAAWDAEGAQLKSQAKAIDAATETEANAPDADAIRASAAQLRAQAEEGSAAPDGGTKP